MPTVLFSSDVTTLELGKSAKLTCQLVNFVPANGGYYVDFFQDKDLFSTYSISAPDSTRKRSTTFENYTNSLPSLAWQSLSSTFPVYEVTVTPTVAGTNEYWCKLDPGTPIIEVDSNRISLTVTPPLPSALLSSTVSSPHLSQPFTLTCTFSNLTPPPAKYSVQFHSLRDGQLATFKVSHGTVLLSIAHQPKVALTQGPKSTFPTFNLVITEKVDASTAYWCALLEEGNAPVKSNTWPLSVAFTSSKRAENQRLGTCAVGGTGLDLNGKAYSIRFFSDLGPKAVNLLGEYSFKPNRFEEFRSFPVPPWTSLRHGPSTSWPDFSLLATGTGPLKGTWWCVLTLSVEGAPDYREITSNKVHL